MGEVIQEKVIMTDRDDGDDTLPLLGPYVSEGDSDDVSSVGDNESQSFPDSDSSVGDAVDMWDNHPTIRNSTQK